MEARHDSRRRVTIQIKNESATERKHKNTHKPTWHKHQQQTRRYQYKIISHLFGCSNYNFFLHSIT